MSPESPRNASLGAGRAASHIGMTNGGMPMKTVLSLAVLAALLGACAPAGDPEQAIRNLETTREEPAE